MSIQKECADHLRSHHRNLTGEKLRASHAHELVAAFFGYGTAAALRAEAHYPLGALREASFLFPDLRRLDVRVGQIVDLPANLPTVDDLATELSDFLVANGHFSGEVWLDRDLSDHVNDHIQKRPMLIEDALSGEIATTNAHFNELYIEDYDFQKGDGELIVTLEGALNGESDQDRAFHGDKIAFSTTMTFGRIAGRIAYAEPKLLTEGAVDDSAYYET